MKAIEHHVMNVTEWLAVRKEAALKIVPETAEVSWWWGQVADPYGVLELGDDWDCMENSFRSLSG